MLTDIKIKAAKPAAKPMKLTDGGGLYLEVSKAGTKKFRLTYRHSGERRTMTIGEWPRVRRQRFWASWRPDLREGLAHLVGLIMRRICGEASAGLRLSVV